MSWSEYFEKIKNRPVRKLLLNALREVSEDMPKTAIELGSGPGIDTLHLLNEGWSVTAVEKESQGIQMLKAQLSPEQNSKLDIVESEFENLINLPKASLVYSALSLPFCKADAFPQFWKVIDSSFGEKCVFATNFFGPEDDWVKNGMCTGHTKEQIREMLKSFPTIKFAEDKEMGKTATGPDKFWHVYHVIAIR
ncbi:methyltransferase domain-containing protein [Bdellovibrio sp. KM01]|uniref:methyltransferase domain-containing protein n=1 Tax=Bdellovibrio sp. KM01 TaxID=2748865 RepID=UPI0015E96419|nr:methyltransferase domain-containing protein [Bdellovibrio sp. KM01]QLY25847.1 methyltransferase domain-containing protein [Bdellovibrio sp. KM01]